MKTLIMDPSVRPDYVRHDHSEAICKKLADYNREKDRATVEELAFFDILTKENITKAACR